ncbi:O-antigen/teichoic acid export membrane protein [Dysgonomonadaceae bacterium PH5-43]|nr:O-antigen/teichoic acid export membrane protein [Dysgonomonadaceae bacterium PH5-43]
MSEITDNKSSYRQVVKATSIFGGVQVFNILISLVRTKFIAMLLGPAGTGYMGLLNAPIGFINTLTGLGIDYSAVRDISEANESGDSSRLSKTVTVFRRWVWITGLLGLFAVLFLSPLLSKWSFGNTGQTLAFAAMSITLLVGSISGGQSAILRGTRRIKDTARAGIYGSIAGLFTSLPLYYFFGQQGIVPSFIIAAFTGLFFSWYYSRKVKTSPVSISMKETWTEGKAMVKLGFMMTLTGLVGALVNYIIISFISNQGGIDQVGLYNAGYSITNQYVGMVFAAMGADYYPRLAGVNKDNAKVKEAVNQQAEISILIIAPIMILFLLSLPILIRILYTTEYLPIIPFTQWVVLGMLFKTASWCLGFIVLAKGATKLYFWTETIANVILLLLTIGGYYLCGLEGTGIAFACLYLFYFSLMWILCAKKYRFNFTGEFIKLFVLLFLCLVFAFMSVYFISGIYGYLGALVVAVIIGFISWKELNKRIGLKEFVKNRIRK